METTKEQWLINYILTNGFLFNSTDLEKHISGMTASQIIQAMDIAKTLQTDLTSTPLGKELF